MRFDVGQRVRIVQARSAPQLLGTVCTITSGLLSVSPNTGARLPEPLYATDLESPMGVWLGAPRCFAPIDDGHEKTSWSDCVWQPQGVEA